MSSESGDPTRLVDRLVAVGFTILFAVMALYGAVQIVSSIWVPLCIGAAAIAVVVGVWVAARRWRGF